MGERKKTKMVWGERFHPEQSKVKQEDRSCNGGEGPPHSKGYKKTGSAPWKVGEG